MAEVAAGAVTSLLGVIRSEARLLRLVRTDVQFIKEEMESMKSFLLHLAGSAPPGGEHDEQVRTWMNQVRLLAQDCNNCIDLYLYRGNPDIHRASGGIRRYLWWITWFLHKLVAKHRAAVRLRELKDRARDVGERRLRYGVEVPSNKSAAAAAAGQSPPAGVARLMSASSSSSWAAASGYAAGDDEEDGDDDDQLAMADRCAQRALLSRTLEEYVKTKLFEWSDGFQANAGETMSIAIVAPDRDSDALKLAYETMVFGPDFEYDDSEGYDCAVLVDIPAVHPDALPLRPKEVLYYILRQLKLEQEQSESQSRKQGTDQSKGEEEDLDSLRVYFRKLQIYREKKRVLNRIKENIKRMKIYDKLDEIKSGVKTRPLKGQQKGMDQKDPDVYVLLRTLLKSFVPASQHDQSKNKDMPKLSASDDTIIAVAKKLMEHVEADEQDGEGGEGGVGRGVEDKAVPEEGREGGGRGETVEEHGGGRGEILEEHEGVEETVEEYEGGGNDNDEEDDSYDDDDSYEDDESEDEEQQIAPNFLHENQYVHILRQVFPKATTSNKYASKQATDTTLGEDQIKQMIEESKQEILVEPQEGKHGKMQDTGQNTEDVDIFTKIVDHKMDKLRHEFKEQLKIKGLVDDIKRQLGRKRKCPLFVLKIDETVDLPRWEDTRNALTLLGCSADVLVITASKDIQKAKEYCYPQSKPIDYSLAGLYYDTVLEITGKQKNEENYKPQIFRNILEQCESNELCMKIFTRALYVNPKRSNEELNKLHMILQDYSPKSSVAKNMLKFSYTDMPKEYKTCLLYLAIFPQGHKVRRSTLIGRWVAEGLIFKEDWPSSVRWANRCFDELINRCLVDPADIGAAGKVKSCVVREPVHGFITKIAKKQHIVETRLSSHLAHHFSIFNDLQLRRSDRIDGFFKRLSRSSRVSLLKVLDLQGCRCFGEKNQRYLEDICSKMLLLKYLSLRGTDVTQLPSKINNLRELEVLDIRQTNVPMEATANVLLLKLKRLLAGHIDRSPQLTLGTEGLVSSAVQIPHKIEQMVNMEVLSNVQVRRSRDLKDIGKLWQLRKLGVVVNDNFSYLKNLLRTISDLHECLCSLSITLPTATSSDARRVNFCGLPVYPLKLSLFAVSRTTRLASLATSEGSQSLKFKHPPKLLEGLSISGTTHNGNNLLPLFVMKDDVEKNNLVKLTLSSTSLYQVNLDDLAKLPKLQFIRLRDVESTDILDSHIVFKKDEFQSLRHLLVEGSTFTKISFMDGAACMLEKMALSFTNIESISGVHRLQKLEDVELTMSSSSEKKNDTLLSSFNNGKQIRAKLKLVGTSLEQGDQQIQNMITFKKGKFRKLRLLTVDYCANTKVVFNSGSAPKLEKIVCSSSATSLSGFDELPRLKELEFNCELVLDEVQEAIKSHKNKPDFKHNKPEIQDQAKGDDQEDDDDAAWYSLFCCNKQV